MRTVYEKEIYEGIVMTTDPAKPQKLGLGEGGQNQYVVTGQDQYVRTFLDL